MLTKRRSVQ